MIDHEKYLELLQWHSGVELFDYDQTVDWAIEMIQKGVETENLLIIASFSKPTDREEIKPYIIGVLQEFDLEEKYGYYSTISHVHYYLELILCDHEIRRCLETLYHLSLEKDGDHGIFVFFTLYHAWSDLETEGYNYYYEGATLDNIESILKMEAQNWINTYIHGIDGDSTNEKKEEQDPVDALQETSIWNKIISYLKKKI